MQSFVEPVLLSYLLCRYTRALFTLFFVLLCSSKLDANSDIPPGFESLLEPQTTLVDIHYGGRFLISSIATFSIGEIQFSAPEVIVDAIPDLLDKQRILNALKEPLSPNADLICFSEYQNDCGVLKPEIAGVIFNESNYRATLFIAETELAVSELAIDKYLPESSAGYSLINGASLLYSGQSSDNESTEAYSLSNLTLVGLGENRLRIFSNYSSSRNETDKAWVFDRFSLERDFKGQSSRAGVLQTNNQLGTFLPSSELLGFGISSDINTRSDLDYSEGIPIEVFLTAQSRVEIYKDGRLVSTGFYGAGNQTLDTRQLPDGAYNVDIRIVDDFGRINTETRFYAKSNRLPPIDQPSYFLNFGQVRSRDNQQSSTPQFENVWLLSSGYSKRLTNQIGGNIGFSHMGNQTMLEVGSFILGKFYDFNFDIAFGDEKEVGISAFANFNWRASALTLNYQEMNTRDRDESESAANIPSINSGLPRFFENTFKQYSANLSLPLFARTRLSLSGRVNERDEGTTRENYVASLDFPTLRMGPSDLRFQLDASKSNADRQYLFSVTLSGRSKHTSSSISQTQVTDQQESITGERQKTTRNRQNANINWNDRDYFNSDINAFANFSKEQQTSRQGIGMNIDSRYGGLDLSLNQVDTASTQNLSKTLSARTTLLIDQDKYAIGGSEISQSALLINLTGEPNGAEFQVLINNIPRGLAKIGRPTVVNLRPFETYKVSVLSKDNAIINYDNTVKTVTLYPGNVVTLGWEAHTIDVIFGNIIDEDGIPIKNALIEGAAELAITDDTGFFQAEIKTGTQRLKVKTREMYCEVKIPRYMKSESQIYAIGTLVCSKL